MRSVLENYFLAKVYSGERISSTKYLYPAQAIFCLPPKFSPAIDRLDSQFPGSDASPRRLEVHGIAADLPAEADPAFASKFLHHLDRHGGSDWP
jgi:hypothetical protein